MNRLCHSFPRLGCGMALGPSPADSVTVAVGLCSFPLWPGAAHTALQLPWEMQKHQVRACGSSFHLHYLGLLCPAPLPLQPGQTQFRHLRRRNVPRDPAGAAGRRPLTAPFPGNFTPQGRALGSLGGTAGSVVQIPVITWWPWESHLSVGTATLPWRQGEA